MAASASEINKIWQPNNFSKLCKLITDFSKKKNRSPLIPVFLGIKAERSYLERITKNCGALNLAGLLHLDESAFLVRDALFCLGLDTGIVHVASNLQTKTFVIYGPSNFILSEPMSADSVNAKVKTKVNPKANLQSKKLFYPIYHDHPHIAPHQRKQKRYRKILDINLITPAEVLNVIKISHVLD